MGFFKKRIKNTFDIARETGVDEEKIKELVNGERSIEGETINKVMTAINRDKHEREIEKLNIFEWYKNTDLKALRESFGYEKQLHLSSFLGIDKGEFNRFENKKFNRINNTIIKMYDFYHNDFNKRIDKNAELSTVKKQDVTATKTTRIKSENYDKIMEWYNNTDIKALRGTTPQKELARLSHVAQSSLSVIEQKKFEEKKDKVSFASLERLYNYYNSKKNKHLNGDRLLDWYNSVDIKALRGNKMQREVSKEIGIAQSCYCDIENKKLKIATPNLEKVYNYYNSQIENVNETKNVLDISHNEINNAENILTQSQPNKDDIYNWYTSIEDLKEYRRQFGYSLNKMMSELNASYDQIRDFESHKYKSATPIVCKFYNFYMDESHRRPAIEWCKEENTNITPIENTSVTHKEVELTGSNDIVGGNLAVPYYHAINNEPCENTSSSNQEEELLKIIEEQNNKITSLERQIMLYEKLIERLP